MMWGAEIADAYQAIWDACDDANWMLSALWEKEMDDDQKRKWCLTAKKVADVYEDASKANDLCSPGLPMRAADAVRSMYPHPPARIVSMCDYSSEGRPWER